jgi:DNA replication and repair protein RecF
VRLSWVELREFRNHRSTKLDVPEGLVVVVGANGEGKTNLLEAMYYLFSLTSPRVSAPSPLVRHGSEDAYVRGEVETIDGSVLVEIQIPQRGASRVHVNKKPVRRKRDLRRRVRAVFFTPEDLDVVRGDPGRRRGFMDEAVVGLWPLREGAMTAYERALRQRNRSLKDWEGRGAPPGIEAWDAELVQSGSVVIRARAEAVRLLQPGASEEFEHLAGYGLHVQYRPSVPQGAVSEGALEPGALEDAFRRRIEERRADELVRRTSLVGPHRDDLDVAVRDLGARSFASHGEAWAAALCLRIGLAVAVAGETREQPVQLLDDPFSALDPRRQRQVAERLSGRGQVVISVADEAHVPRNATCVWDVSGGAVKVRQG